MTISIENSTTLTITDADGVSLSMITGADVYQPFAETTPSIVALKAELAKKDSLDGLKLADFGAGTGQIGVIAKKFFPALEVHAYDNDPAAEKYILANAELNNLEVAAHIMDVADISNSDKFDVVMSTPPFYPEVLKKLSYSGAHLQDPDSAVFSGVEGLDAQEVFINKAAAVLNQGGFVIAVHSPTQKDAVYAMLTAAGLSDLNTVVVDNGEEFNIVDAVYTVAYKN
jgi:release factor glutamine methyltransferase